MLKYSKPGCARTQKPGKMVTIQWSIGPFPVWVKSSISKIFENFNWDRKYIYLQQIKFSRNFTVVDKYVSCIL
jgi:hypothetical protein